MNQSRRAFILQSAMAAAGWAAGLPAVGAGASPSFPARAAGSRKLCLFSKHVHWLDYEQMAQAAASLGFEGIDLTVRPGGHVLPEKVAEDLPRAVAAIRKAGLEIPMITTAIQSASGPHTEAILKTAAELGIGHYRMGWLSYNPNLSMPDNLKHFRSGFQQLQRMNRKYRIHGAYQNHAGEGFGAAAVDLWTVIRDMDPNWIGCQYDIRHATVEGANSWPIGLRLLKDHIRTINLKDFQWTKTGNSWKAENVPLGNGLVDFRRYFALLTEIGFTGPVSLHYEYPLGGAEGGASQISLPREQVLRALESDLSVARKWLSEPLQ